MAQLYQNRHKNAESHLFGDEPPPEHYEIAPETIQGLRDANNNRRRAMESNLFAGESKPTIQNAQNTLSPDSDNRYKNLESHLAFGATPSPQIQPQLSQPNQVQNTKYQPPYYTNQKPRYQPPQMPPPQIHLKPKLQPLAPAPNQDEYNFRQNANQGTSLLKQFRQNQDQQNMQPGFSQMPAQQPLRPAISQIDYSSIPNLTENLAQIDNSLPSISPRKFLVEDKTNQNVVNQQQPQTTRAPLSTPRHPTFIYTQVKETQIPTFQVSDLVQNSQVPQLSPFPNFDFDLAPIDNNFAFVVKPLTSSGQRYPKKLNLNNSAGSEMKKMRDELEKDAQQFDSRIKRIEKVEIVQPMRPVTPAADDPPTLDFSFATPRSMWNLDRRLNANSNENGRKSNIKSDVPDLNFTNTVNRDDHANNEVYQGGNGYNNNDDDNDDGGGAGLMSTQSDFIYLDNQDLN